jgi:hypothetical protein
MRINDALKQKLSVSQTFPQHFLLTGSFGILHAAFVLGLEHQDEFALVCDDIGGTFW